MSKSENPSFKDERSTEPYNEDKVSSPQMLERLKRMHEKSESEFKGDWSQLERLIRNLDDDDQKEGIKPEGRLQDWDEWAKIPGGKAREYIHLEGANLEGANLEGANLGGAHLEGANLYDADLAGAYLLGAHLHGAEFLLAHLERADLSAAHLERANLRLADLEGANLLHARLDEADLTHASGVRFDSNSIHRTKIDGNANDPWSVLRRKYTGPWFFVHMLLLIVFFTPHAAKFLYLSGLASVQAHIAQQADVLEHDLQGHERAVQAIREMQRRYKETHRETRAAWVLVGWTETWWAFTMVIVLVAYNAFRGILTLRVSALRDEEERSQVTPYLDAYWPLFLCHRIAKALMWIAIGSALFHTGYWAWTTTVWVAL